MLIRTYDEKDLGDIADLEKRAFAVGPYSRRMLKRLFNVRSAFNFVAEIEGRVIGYVLAMPLDKDSADVESIAVDPEHQGSGIGSVLMERIEGEMKRRGFLFSILEVRDKNYESINFYKAHGYGEIEHLPEYYHEEFRGSRGAYRMIKKLV